MRSTLIVAACLYATAAGMLACQTLDIVPERVSVDESAAIRAHGLEPNERVTIQTELLDKAGEPWASHADFIADAQGTVDLSKQAPAAGSYKQPSAMGLIWSMLPSSNKVNVYIPPEFLGPQTIRFRLLRKSAPVATAELEQDWLAAGILQTKLEGALHGVLFEPASGGPHPGVLVLGGSEGGVPLRPAAWLASHGYAALALAYFRYENLPPNLQAIPLEYFGQALGWMRQRPQIAADRIGVMGTSRGGELALQLASMYPHIKTAVAFVPANTLHGLQRRHGHDPSLRMDVPRNASRLRPSSERPGRHARSD